MMEPCERLDEGVIMPSIEAWPKPTAEILADIEALDLDPIEVKLMDESEGHRWSREYADLMIREYRRFLQLNIMHPDQTIVCSTEVDHVWHAHILDTQKYADDCERTFGFFLHHFPYFGMRGEEDAAALQRSFEESNVLYEQAFGEIRPELDASKCNTCGAGSCGHPHPWCSTCTGVSGTESPLRPDRRPTLA
jgi:hypothetical protein